MTAVFRDVLEAEKREARSQVSTVLHPNGTLVCATDAALLACVTRLVLDLHRSAACH